MSQSERLTVEWAPFSTLPGVTEAEVKQAANALESEFLNWQIGYIRRELLKGDGNTWVDLIHWDSDEAAQNAMASIHENEACQKYFSLMAHSEEAEAKVLHFKQVKAWE